MKISLRKRIIAFMLSVILLFSGSISGFASELLESDPMAEAAAAVVSEEATEPATEAATEATETSAAIISEEITEATEAVTEEVTEAATEAVTEEATEAAAKEETVEETEEEIVEETETETVEETEEETEETEEETEEVVQVLEYEDNDVKIHVEAVGADTIPEGASLKVSPITSDDAEYNKVEQQLNEKAEGEEYEIAGFLAYDITFVDKDGNKVEPNGDVRVTIDYKKATLPEEVNTDDYDELDVTVMHFEENANGEVKEVVDMVAEENIEAEVKTTTDIKVEKAEFVTNSFSAFVITWTISEYKAKVTVHYVDENGNEIGESQLADVSYTKHDDKPNLNNYQIPIDGYTYQKTVADSFNGGKNKEVSSIQINREGSYYNRTYKLQYNNGTWTDWGTISKNVTLEKHLYIVYKLAINVPATIVSEDGTELTTTTIELEEETAYLLNESEDIEINAKTYKYLSAYVMEEDIKVPVESLVYIDGTYFYIDENKNKTELGEKELYLVYEEDKLHPVATVDHISKGIVMRMIDYNDGGENYYGLGGRYGNGNIKYDIVSNTLTNGYPTSVGGQSLAGAFSGGTTVNHLFLQNTYNQTGYYEYSSFSNYAYLGSGTNFTVYEELGTPNGSTDSTKYYYQRGNFLPYNAIEPGKLAGNTNKYDEYGNTLTGNRAGEPLYQAQGGINYYFGMYMEVPFAQPRDGYVNWNGSSSPMRYDFNGDDDLWIFIDDVLVLDIGGIHDAHSGYIDFATGVVGWYDCKTGEKPVLYTTTIKKMFEEAKRFPDGSKWDSAKVDQYFDGDTFVDYSAHTMKMFYMERGAGASNLHVKFNIPVIPKGTFNVSKELTNTDKEKYANVEFAFQAFAQKIESKDATTGVETYSENEYVPLNASNVTAVYKGTTTAIEFKDDQTFNSKEYDNVFYLKPGETASFSGLQENRKYYVSEVGVNSQEFDKVIINGTAYTEFLDDNQQSVPIANFETSKAEVSKRPLVVYQNSCSLQNLRELRITKAMKDGKNSDDSFTVKVMLESVDGELVPYVGPYYLQDAEGNYWTYVDGVLTNNGKEAAPCGTTNNGLIPDMKVGYTASITQILSGTEFSVEEVDLDTGKYSDPVIKVVESTAGEKTNEKALGTILLGKDAEVVVTNSYKEPMTVSKTFVDLNEAQIESLKDTFKIILTDQDGVETELSLNGDAVKTSVEGEPITYTWTLEGFAEGTYSVYEIGAELVGYDLSVKLNNADIDMLNKETMDAQEVTLTSSVRTIRFRNIYTAKTIDLDLRKVSVNGPEIEGAEFDLYKYDDTNDDTTSAWVKVNEERITATNAAGSAKELTGLTAGKYKLVEVKAPEGFVLLEGDIYFKVENETASLTDENGNALTSEADMWMLDAKGKVLTVENDVLYALPSSGGIGIYWYMIAGMFLMMAATVITYKNRREEVLERINRR